MRIFLKKTYVLIELINTIDSDMYSIHPLHSLRGEVIDFSKSLYSIGMVILWYTNTKLDHLYNVRLMIWRHGYDESSEYVVMSGLDIVEIPAS